MKIYFDLGIDFNINRAILLSTVSDLRQPKKVEKKMKTYQISKTGGYTNGRFLSGISEVRADGCYPTGYDFDRTESSNFAQREEVEIMRQINAGEKTFTDFPRKIIKWSK